LGNSTTEKVDANTLSVSLSSDDEEGTDDFSRVVMMERGGKFLTWGLERVGGGLNAAQQLKRLQSPLLRGLHRYGNGYFRSHANRLCAAIINPHLFLVSPLDIVLCTQEDIQVTIGKRIFVCKGVAGIK